MKRSWVVVGCFAILAACGAPVDERARVAGVLQGASPPPSIVTVREAEAAPRPLIVTLPRPIAMTPLAPRPTEAAPPRRRAVSLRQATPTYRGGEAGPGRCENGRPAF